MTPGLRRAAAITLMGIAYAMPGARAQNPPPDLTTLKIEDLMNVDVTSASKKTQKISRVPAAIFVITQDDIERSGATSVADVLRMVPGLEVAQITPSAWAITARGFNGQYVNKLLVLIDGVAVYTPIYSGVYWDQQDVSLDSIERIEIIRGPGASVWGANAVNGVINISTKRARDTQGILMTAHGGTIEHGGGSVRYGGKIGDSVAYRVFAEGWQMGHYLTPAKQNGHDDWHAYHAGFRGGTDPSRRDSFVLQAGVARGNAGEIVNSVVSLAPPLTADVTLRTRFSDWNVLGRWKHVVSPSSDTSLQVYFDRSNRTDTTYGFGLNTVDIDFQNHVSWGRQDFVWGLGYRLNADGTAPDFRISVTPAKLKYQIFGSFLQDEIAIVRDRLYLTLGAKFEHEHYNGFNLQPTVRLAWIPSNQVSLWAAFSGAQRTPSRVETAIRYNVVALPGANGLPVLTSVLGNPEQKNERLIATEAGFRKDVSHLLSFDATAFFNQYHDLRSIQPGTPQLEADPPPLHLLVPATFANQIHGETHGLELFANLKVANRWTLSPGYSFLTMHLHQEPTSKDPNTAHDSEGGVPRQQAQLRSNVSLPWHLQWTSSAYFVDRLPAQTVPSYTRLDTNLAWQSSDGISFGVVGQNLQKSLHPEWAGDDLTENPSLIRRSAYAWLAWRF